MDKQIIYYKDNNGKSPFLEWYNSLDNSPKAKVIKRLQKIERGLYGKTRTLKQRLIELKFESGLRIYFVEDGNIIVILLCGGGKDNQNKDIKKAYEYINDLEK
jgi:putative addiction module killer protein